MADGSKPGIENLELGKETVQDLTEPQAEAARGGSPGALADAGHCHWSARAVCATRFLEHCQGIP